MKLIVLGRYGPYPAANGTCSGYLLEHESCPVLLECGNGVLSRLQNYYSPWELEAVMVSHLHGDHISDLLIMRYAMDIAQNMGRTEKTLEVYTPGEPEEELSRLPFKEAYRLKNISPASRIEVGPYIFSFLPVKHPLPTFAVKVECAGKTLVYSGDTEYVEELINFAGGADLFLCEANYQDEDIKASRGNHLSASQAAQIAAQAGVQRLVLTHLPAFRDISKTLEEAQNIFPGAELAREEAVYEI